MKKSEIITTVTEMIQREAYTARICDELQGLGFDVGMMKYYRDIASGKAFGGMQILGAITGKSCDLIYEMAVEDATDTIKKANYNIIELLNYAGFDGEEYYRIETMETRA